MIIVPESNNAKRLICSVLLLPVVWICIVICHNIIHDRNAVMETNNRLPAEQDRRNNVNSCCMLLRRLSWNHLLYTVNGASILLSEKIESSETVCKNGIDVCRDKKVLNS